MPQDLPFACRCGALTGTLHDAAPHTVGHLVCYCRDCRAFVRHLGQADQLEPGGGVPLIQTVPARIDIATGAEHIACKKLTDKGLLRWYAACCDTPLANTPKTAKLPFAGMWRGLFPDTAAFGPVAALGFTKSALPDPESGRAGGMASRTRTSVAGQDAATNPLRKTSASRWSRKAP